MSGLISVTSPVFDPGADTGVAYATTGNQAGWKHKTGVGADGNAAQTGGATADGSLLRAIQPGLAQSGATKSGQAATRTSATKTDGAASAFADAAKTAPAKATTRIDQGESQEIHTLKAQGQNLSEIAVDLGIPLARVNDDLETDIPKFTAPVPPGQVPPAPANSSIISVFV